MNIADLFKHKTVFSLEVFPPKKYSSVETVLPTLTALKNVNPDFISVTLGAGGSAQSDGTVAVVNLIQNHLNIPAVAHVPGLYQDQIQVDQLIQRLQSINVDNILALRGDAIPGLSPRGVFNHASDLIAYVHEKYPNINIASACYPECHQEATSFLDDINHLKLKIDSGSDHLISQLFFDNNHFYDFQEKLALAGINVPVEAGIMPCTSKNQIERIAQISGVPVPEKFKKILNRYADNKVALKDAGIAYAIDQIVDLVSQGVDGIHLYTMNKPDVAQRIWDATKNIFGATKVKDDGELKVK
ncbi:methylenetetrahydrofolate reductase [NAD(P)H] [Lactobacillus sp. Sy-1]|uniref:methylenetetrahydrofolate reductase [NAD(P)H] n=1 Tax=Lactobacillus sp. Sy-1 TaxID=2109645 RepID=UPI001C5A5EA2|nr:methylenetetrahydrofolate reductase [NAD(P)H] [Lactobacillus sp. Sy-1]MBW1606431.1 methylenetetrahydrofolate reductase [NAD(P)H] [Lactobacillus sp. Sy-1]